MDGTERSLSFDKLGAGFPRPFTYSIGGIGMEMPKDYFDVFLGHAKHVKSGDGVKVGLRVRRIELKGFIDHISEEPVTQRSLSAVIDGQILDTHPSWDDTLFLWVKKV